MGKATQKSPRGPVVIVHREWRRPKNAAVTAKTVPQGFQSSLQDQTSSVMSVKPGGLTSKFEFVNATSKPDRNRDPDARRLIKVHVMKKSFAKYHKKSRVPEVSSHDNCQTVVSRIPAVEVRPAAIDYQSVMQSPPILGDVINTGNIHLEPCMQELLVRYCATVSKAEALDDHLTKNTCSKSWLSLAMLDDAGVHALLYTAALQVGLYEGSRETKLAALEMTRSLRLINERLNDAQSGISDAILGAVGCMAICAAVSGNFAAWNSHIAGAKQMIKMRGGMAAIDSNVRIKLFRAEITGAVDTMSIPQLEFQGSQLPTLSSTLGLLESPAEIEYLLQTLSLSGIQPSLVDTFKSLHGFSQAISHSKTNKYVLLDHSLFIEHSQSLQYRLLSFEDKTASNIQEACRIGALIYIREVLQTFPFAVTGPQYLIFRLKNSLSKCFGDTSPPTPLLVWILIIGGIATKAGPDRMWFVAHLAKLSMITGLSHWNDIKFNLKGLLWIEEIHKVPCRKLWEEVEVTKTVLIGIP